MGGLYMWVCRTALTLRSYHTPTQFFTSSWEFLTTLEYELGVIRGLRPYRWTIWVSSYVQFPLTHRSPGMIWSFAVRQVYSLARVSALLMVIFAFVLVGNLGPINCKVAYFMRLASRRLCPDQLYISKVTVSLMSVSTCTRSHT